MKGKIYLFLLVFSTIFMSTGYASINSISFISFDISKYSNKVINLQVTGKRGGKRNVYINGNLLKSFTSGSTVVNYN